MLILDTDIWSIIQRAEGVGYVRLVSRLPAGDPQSVFITIISIEEQARGWLGYIARAGTMEQYIRAYGRLHELVKDLAMRQILDFEDAAAQQLRQLVQAKIRIGKMDLKIASISLVNNAILLSRNLKDFRKVPGLRVEDWTAP